MGVLETKVDSDDVGALHAYVLDTIGGEPIAWPGGWPDEIEAALLDAVFSVRAKYGNRERRTGVYGAVLRWRDHRGVPADDLRALVDVPSEELQAVVANNGTIAGRHKAEVVHDAAVAFVNCHIRTANDFRDHQDEARRAYLSVKGCGPVTWAYLRILTNVDDVKADTWINRFVHDRIPDATTAQAAALVTAVAARMHVDARRLDHAIWAYRRARSD